MPEHSCLTFPLYCVEPLPAQLLEHSPRRQSHGLPLFFRTEKEVVPGVVVLLIFVLVLPQHVLADQVVIVGPVAVSRRVLSEFL